LSRTGAAGSIISKLNFARGAAMKKYGLALLFLVPVCLAPPNLPAQSCKDDESMVSFYVKSLNDLAGEVKKESLDDFQKQFHQKTFVNKLNLSSNIIQGAVSCFDKAAQDPAATKEQTDAYKAARAKYAKLQTEVDKDKAELKGVAEAKEAKSRIEKLELTD
jgi:hypothetical protein